MKILLLYFTGTYNTRYITNLLKKRFLELDNQVTTLEINASTEVVSLEDYDLIGLGYPIYAFNAPSIFISYLNKLTFNDKAKYFIYKNSGETLGFNNASSREIKHLLRKNKAELINEKHFIMPYNIMFRFKDNCIKESLNYDDKLADILVYELMNGIKSIIKNNLLYEMTSLIFMIQRPGAKINHYFYKVDETKCTKCHMCVNNCPTNNIEVDKDGKIKFNNNCIMCMRCSFLCPVDAINIGMLNPVKVNKPYNFKEIKEDKSLDGKFIKDDQKGFFKCYKKTYKNIDLTYDKYFKKG